MLNRKIKFRLLLLLLNFLFIHSVYAEPNKPVTREEKLQFILDQFVETSEEYHERSKDGPLNETLEEARLARGRNYCWTFEPKYYQAGPHYLTGGRRGKGVFHHPLDAGEPYKWNDMLISPMAVDSTYTQLNDLSQADSDRTVTPMEYRIYLEAYYKDLDIDSILKTALEEAKSAKGEDLTPDEIEQITVDENTYLNQYLESSPDGEFVGYISFSVILVIEPYQEAKHGEWPYSIYRGRVPGEAMRLPVRFTGYREERYSATAMLPSGGTFQEQRVKDVPEEKIAYEICYAPRIHEPSIDMSVWPEYSEPERTGPRYTYHPGDVPIAVMYDMNRKRRLEDTDAYLLEQLQKTYWPLMAIRFIRPEVNLLLIPVDYLLCLERGGSACLGQAVVDAALAKGARDGGYQLFYSFVKVPFSGKAALPALKAITKDVGLAANGGLFLFGFAGEISLAAYHIHREEYMEAFGRLLSTTVNLSPVILGRGKVVAANLGEAKPVCADINTSIPGKKIATGLSKGHVVQDVCEDIPEAMADLRKRVHLGSGSFQDVERIADAADVHKYPKDWAGNQTVLAELYPEVSEKMLAKPFDTNIEVLPYKRGPPGSKHYLVKYVEGRPLKNLKADQFDELGIPTLSQYHRDVHKLVYDMRDRAEEIFPTTKILGKKFYVIKDDPIQGRYLMYVDSAFHNALLTKDKKLIFADFPMIAREKEMTDWLVYENFLKNCPPKNRAILGSTKSE